MKAQEARRTYRMTSRAETSRATGERILDAVTELFWEHPSEQIVLREVADRAGVTVQTVIRRYGGKEGLLAAAYDRGAAQTVAERSATPGDVPGAVAALLQHYEHQGTRVLRLLAEEHASATAADFADRGRAMHRDWCRAVFASALEGLTGVEQQRRLAQLVAVCDVYTWKLLRRDAGLSLRQTEIAVHELLGPLLAPGKPSTKESR
jgi:AcrR family transcriptional regulator